MSREIDERIVQMKFESKEFNKNIQTSIHNIDELKRGMDFKDAVKGFDDIDSASRRVDMGALGAAVDGVKVKFGFLDVFAVKVMSRISDAILNAANSAKRLVTELSIDQITPGWTKYEQKTSSVQTIMAATAKQFTNTATQMEVVNAQLDKLNWFTDETSYNFVDMVNNIGKFTSNNIGLEESVTAMQGIANWAAISGANANEASRAMYNLAQALATGSVKLIDWKSIENANMATTEFKQTVIDIAAQMGTLEKVSEGVFRTLDKKTEVTVSNFNEGLSKGWFTKDVLMTALNRYGAATNKLNEITEKYGMTASSLIQDIDKYTAATAKAREEVKDLGWTEEQVLEHIRAQTQNTVQNIADSWDEMDYDEARKALEEFDTELMQFGLKSFKAAQEAKTFTEALDSVKDAVSTGWMKSFEIMFGDYTNAKEFWTNIANTLYDIFASGGDARNEMLKDWADLKGREYFTDTIYAGLAAILSILSPINAAFQAVFGKMTGKRLFDITAKIHDFVLSLVQTEETASKIFRVFTGVFGVIDIGKTTITRFISGALNLLRRVLKELNIDVGEFAANAGDALYSFSAWYKKSTFITDAFDKIGDAIIWVIREIRDFIAAVKEFGPVKAVLDTLHQTFGENFQGISGIFLAVGAVLQWLWDRFKEFKMPKNLDDVKQFFKDFGSAVKSNLEAIGIDFTALDGIVDRVKDNMKGSIEEVEGGIDLLQTKFGSAVAFVAAATKEVDWAGVLLAGFGLATLAIIWKMAEALNGFAGALKNVTGVGGAAKDAFNSIKDYFKSLHDNIKAESLLKTSIAVAALAISFGLFSQLSWDQIGRGAVAMVALGVALATLSMVLKVVGQNKATGAASISTYLLSFAASVMLLSLALKAMPEVSQIKDGLGALMSILVTFGAVSIAVSRWAKPIQASAWSMIGIAASISLLVKTMASIGREDLGSIYAATPVVIALMTALAVLSKLMTFTKSEFVTGGGLTRGAKYGSSFMSVISLVVGLHLLIAAIKSLGKADPATLAQGIIAMIPVVLLLKTLFRAARIAGAEAKSAGKMVLYISLALGIMVPVLKNLAALSLGELAKGGAIIAALSTFIIQPLVETSKDAGKYGGKAGLMILEIAGALAIMQLVIKTLGKVDVMTLIKGTASMSIVILSLAEVIRAINKEGESNANSIKVANRWLVMIGIVGALILAMSVLNPNGALVASIGISAVLLSVAAFMKIVNGIEMVSWNSVLNLTVTIGAIGTVLGLIGVLGADWKSMLAASAGISMVLLSIATMTQIMKKSAVGTALEAKVKALIPLVTTVGAFMGAFALISALATSKGGTLKDVLYVTTAMSEIMIAMGIFSQLIKKTSPANPALMDGLMTFIGEMAGIVAILGILVSLAGPNFNAKGTLALTTAMSEVIIAVGLMLRIMKGVEMPNGLDRTLLAIGIFIAGIGTVLTLLASLASYFGTDAFSMLALSTAISEIIIAIGAATRIMKGYDFKASLPQVAVLGLLVAGIGAVLGYFSGMTDPAGVLVLATGMSEVLLAISASAVILSHFKAGGFGGAIEGIGIAIAIVAAMAVLLGVLGGLNELIPNVSKYFEDGAAMMIQIGRGIGGFVGGLVGGALEGLASGFPGICASLSQGMVNLVPFFATLQAIPGGILTVVGTLLALVAMITGAQFISGLKGIPVVGQLIALGSVTLISDFATFGKAIKAFAAELDGLDNAAIERIHSAAEAALALGQLETNLPKKGALMKTLFGEDDLEAFGERLKKFGRALVDFSEIMDPFRPSSADKADKAGKTLTKLEKNLPAANGVLQSFLGQKDIGEFGNRLMTFGAGLAGFSNNMSSYVEGTETKAESAGKALIALENSLTATGGLSGVFFGNKDLGKFGLRLCQFGQALVDFSETVSGNLNYYAFSNAAKAAGYLADLEKGLETTGGIGAFWTGDSSLKKFGQNLAAFGGYLVDFSMMLDNVNFTTLNDAVDYINRLMGMERLSITSTKIVQATSDILNQIYKTINDSEKKMKSAGINVMYWIAAGLKTGATTSSDIVKNASLYIANTIINTINDVLQIHSPSLVMKETGVFIVKGLADGISEETSAEEAAAQKAKNIVSAFDNELSKLTSRGTTADLEYQLWAMTDGKNASQGEINQKQLQLEYDKLATLAKTVGARKAALEAIEQLNGKESEEYQSAYQTYLQAQIDMLSKQQEVDKLNGTMATDERSQMKAYAAYIKENAEAYEFLGKTQDELQVAAYQYAYGLSLDAARQKQMYQKIFDENRDAYEAAGKSLAELDAFAKNASGWDPSMADAVRNSMSETTKIIEENIGAYSLDVQGTIEQATADAIAKGTSKGSAAGAAASAGGLDLGKTVDDAIAEGMNSEEGAEALDLGGEEAMTNWVDNLTNKDGWIMKMLHMMGLEFDTEIVQSMIDNGYTFDQIKDMLQEKVVDPLKDVVPQAETEGMNFVNGYFRGMETTMLKSGEGKLKVAETLATDALKKLANAQESASPSKATMRLGQDFVDGYALGIDKNRASAEATASVMGKETTDALTNVAIQAEQILSPTVGSGVATQFMIGVTSGLNDGGIPAANMSLQVSNNILKPFAQALPVFANLGAQAMIGFREKLIIEGQKAIQAAQQIADSVATIMAGTLEVSSPSKVTMRIGRWTGIGLAKGLEESAHYVDDQATTLAEGTIDTLALAAQAANEILSNDDDLNPVITPVLDLDQLTRDAEGINGVLGGRRGITLDSAKLRVGSIASRQTTNAGQNGSDQSIQQNYNFTQNNYSPKALNRSEIYRQTNNQFSRLKGATKV